MIAVANVWKTFEITNINDYHYFYLKRDVL